VQADLGSAQSASRVVLELPAATAWATRSQTLSLQGSTDGSTWTTLKASASYSFDPATSNTVSISFTASTQRYFRVNFTANTGATSGQLSELQVWNT
jgi:hypothetical protein